MSEQNTSTEQLAKKEQPKTVKDFLALPAFRNRFDEVMGKRAAQFMASITSMVTQSKQLSECEPKSVIAAAFIAATLDLPIDKNLGYAWVIPYKKLAQFQLGSKGYVQLALRSGQYAKLNASPVNAEVFAGYDEVGEPKLDWSKYDDSKPVAGYAAAWRLTNGFTKTVYWSKAKVEGHAQRFSQSFRGGYDSPWKSDFDRMGEKTVMKNALSRWGILSIDLQRAIEHDQGTQDDIGGAVKHDDGSGLFDVGPAESIGSVLGDTKASDALKTPAKAPADEKANAATEPGVAYTDAEAAKVLSEVENFALNQGLTPLKLINHAINMGWKAPGKAKELKELPYATLSSLREYLESEAKKKTA